MSSAQQRTYNNTESSIFSSHLIRVLTIIIHLTTGDPITSIWRWYQWVTETDKYFLQKKPLSKNPEDTLERILACMLKNAFVSMYVCMHLCMCASRCTCWWWICVLRLPEQRKGTSDRIHNRDRDSLFPDNVNSSRVKSFVTAAKSL